MSCSKCKKEICCCVSVISKLGEKGKQSVTPGRPGKDGAAGTITEESGLFTLAANGLSCTGGTIGGTGSNPTITINTTKQVKLAHFNCWYDDNSRFSYGKDDGVRADCVFASSNGAIKSNSIKSIEVLNSTVINGWVGSISVINPTTFVLAFEKIGGGLYITGQWHAITG